MTQTERIAQCATKQQAADVLESLRVPRLVRIIDLDYDVIAEEIILFLACDHIAVITGKAWQRCAWRNGSSAVTVRQLEALKSKYIATVIDCRECCG